MLDSLSRLVRLTRRSQGRGSQRTSQSEARLLQALVDNDNISAGQLADLLGVRPPSLTRALNRLEAQGEVARVRDADDSRVWRIHITEQGQQGMDQRQESYARVCQAIEDSMTADEMRTFVELCEKLGQALGEQAAEGEAEASALPADASGLSPRASARRHRRAAVLDSDPASSGASSEARHRSRHRRAADPDSTPTNPEPSEGGDSPCQM